MRSARVEVSQQRAIPPLHWFALLLCLCALSFDVIRDNRLNHALRATIRVRRPNWAVLGDGYHVWYSGRIAIDGRGGGEDDVGDIVLDHAPEQIDGSTNIDTVVLDWDFGGFANSLEGSVAPGLVDRPAYLQRSEMDHAVYLRVRGKNFVQSFLICHVYLVKFGSSAAEELNAVEGDFRGVVQTVDNDDIVAMLKERKRGEGADVAGASIQSRVSICLG